ncbi:MAG: hypothetical protein HUJ26_24575 [Planctomycetaceae bacterium]|nr:hypothetical protein [Planctomycetaceae bacterium]
MKKLLSFHALLYLVLGCLTLSGDPSFPILTETVQAQEDSAPKTEKKVRKKPRGRVPNHYGKLGLSPKQKESIYAIQAKYREQIEVLEQQLAELEKQEDAEVKNVLTDDQKENLKKILDEVAARKKASTNE